MRAGGKDPVCGMTTDRTGLSSVHDGKRYWFCGAHCKHRFDADPEQFVK